MRTVIAGLLVLAGIAQADVVVGSAAIDRNINDSTSGLSLIYRGSTQPLGGDGSEAATFTFYTDALANTWVTPFLLEIIGPASYQVVGIGASRLTDASGVQSFNFAAIAGSALTEAGKSYTFGYSNLAYQSDGNGGVTEVANTANQGAIPFSGYNDFSDLWSYAFAGAIQMGMIFGDGGVGLDSLGLAGRIYSANMTFSAIPAPASLVLAGTGLFMAARRRR